MAGFDWNQNGEHDCFDDFMDMQVASEVFDDDELTSTYKPTHTYKSAKAESEPLYLSFLKILAEMGGGTIAIVAICVIPFLMILDINWGLIGDCIGWGFIAFLFIRWLRRL